jgi:hypothetical protein
MGIASRLGLVVLVLGALASPASARCLAHEPSVVTLAGVLESRRVPGPPGYRNIARGDYPETILVLKLDDPVCVSADPSSSRNAKSHSSITEVQLAYPLEKAGLLVGKHVRATGSLVDAQSGADRTPVVLKVVGVRAD